MPTGYTADVADGKVTDFRTFALRCARNFGATIMQRDEPMDALPTPREESDYYAKAVADAEQRLAELEAMTTEQKVRAARADYDTRMAYYRESEARRTETRNRYHAMLAEAVEWTPPTPDHEELKRFMLQQLHESIRWDCNSYDPPTPEVPDEWWRQQHEHAWDRVLTARKSLAEERRRVAAANAWIAALYESLSPTEARA